MVQVALPPGRFMVSRSAVTAWPDGLSELEITGCHVPDSRSHRQMQAAGVLLMFPNKNNCFGVALNQSKLPFPHNCNNCFCDPPDKSANISESRVSKWLL